MNTNVTPVLAAVAILCGAGLAEPKTNMLH